MSKPSLASSDLSSNIQRWVADAVGAGTRLESVHPLTGATSSTLHSITARFNGREIKLVLRRFTNTEWLEEEPGLARHEAESLKLAAQAATPTPELIAYDETGERCGVPAILMTQLPGSVELKPRDFDHWLHQLAEVLLPIHSLQVGTFPWHYQPYNDISTLQTPTWSTVPELWERTIEIVNGPQPETHECFIHRDYHPTNVLWQADQVSGIVDWPNACRGAANIDVAWCRANLAYLYGVTAADQFLQAYDSLAGPTFDHHPYWDLIVAIEGLPGPPDVYPPWVEYGVRHLTADLMRERQDEYLVSIFARI
jgi:aminoglycoside phosphotransferase (APT) family kinase protein